MKYSLSVLQDGKLARISRRIGFWLMLCRLLKELKRIGRVNGLVGSEQEFDHEYTIKIERHAERDAVGADAWLGWREPE